MSDHQTTVAALGDCFAAVTAFTADLSPAEWDVQSYCPEWTVRGVLDHLGAVEYVLRGWLPQSADEWPPFDQMGKYKEETASLDGPALQGRLAEIFGERADELAGLDADAFERPCQTPVGPATYGRFMKVRVYDHWLHLRDAALPAGRSLDHTGPAAEISLDEVHGSLGYIVGKKIGLPDGKGITVRLTGDNDRVMHAVVDGRAKVVDELDDADVTLTADFVAFMLLTGGRVDPQQMIDDGKIAWSGDDEWGERAARNLRFTI